MSENETVTRTIKVAGFPYKAKVGDRIVHKFATRGETIELFDPADIARGDNNGHFLVDGEDVPDTQPQFDLIDLGLLTDEQLELLYKEKLPKVADALDAVGDDPELAQRVLNVERSTQKDPRKSLVEGLEKIIEAGAS